MSAKPEDANMPRHAQHDLSTPLARARGLGSAKSGVAHWWIQRVTAIALAPLSLFFIWVALTLMHMDYASAMAFIAYPDRAALLIIFTVAMFWHGQLGLQVVIEDYVHTRWIELTLLILVRFAAALGVVVCVLSIVRIWVHAAP